MNRALQHRKQDSRESHRQPSFLCILHCSLDLAVAEVAEGADIIAVDIEADSNCLALCRGGLRCCHCRRRWQLRGSAGGRLWVWLCLRRHVGAIEVGESECCRSVPKAASVSNDSDDEWLQ